MAQQKLYIFDVCDTLFSEDTTVGLLRTHFRTQGLAWRLWALESIFHSRSPLNLTVRALEKFSGRSFARKWAFLLLRGQRLDALERSATLYLEDLLENCKRAQVWTLLEARPRESQLVLASASLEPIVKALALKLGADYVASCLEERGSIFTGFLARDAKGEKLRLLRERFGKSRLSCSTVVSDNFCDRPLLAEAKRAVIVLRRSRDRARWDLDGAEFIGPD